MFDAVECINQNSERGEVSSVTASDLRKAFDSVDHGVQLSKLGWHGIDPTWLLVPELPERPGAAGERRRNGFAGPF